jgi:glycolate oxidase
MVHHACLIDLVKSEVPRTMANEISDVPWLESLNKIVGPENVKTIYLERAYYFRDHSTDFIDLAHGHVPDAVVLPTNEGEVSQIVAFAAKEKIAIIPRGSGTGFMGGSVAVGGGIIIDLTRMCKIIEIDEYNYRVTAESGANMQTVERELNKKGLTLGFDPGSMPVVSMGGSVSTDQIGGDGWYSNVGSMRHRVMCLRVVLSDGGVVSTGRMVDRSSSTVNLTQLFLGAEGGFGIVTQVTLRVFPLPETTDLRVVVFDSFRQAADATLKMMRVGVWPPIHHTVEVVRPEELSDKAVVNSFGMLVLGFAGPKEVVVAQRERALSICTSSGGVDAGKQAANDYWERHYEAYPANLAGNKVYGMEVVSLPLAKMLPIYDEFCSIIKKHGMQRYGAGFGLFPTTMWVGYIFDNTENGLKVKTAATEEMLKAATGAGGTISGVHGVGYIKRDYSSLEFDNDQLALIRRLKKALDPNGIMNPGKGPYA